MSSRPSLLPAGMVLEGDVEGAGDLVVLGRVTGSVRVEGALVVEQGAEIRGDVHGASVTVRGTLVGDASASEAIRIEESARVVGDLAGPRVEVVEGASFRGRLHIGALATRAAGSLALRAGAAPTPQEGPPASRTSDASPKEASSRPKRRGLPRMPRPGRASGKRRAAL